MDQADVMKAIKAELDSVVYKTEPPEHAETLPRQSSPWLAASVLQKAVRRGDTSWALAASDHLLRIGPDRLWRRVLVIAFEDVGIANLGLVGKIATACEFRRHYEQRGQSRHVLRALTAAMCRSTKCRAADDLHVVIENEPQGAGVKRDWTELQFPDLINCVVDGCLPTDERAAALWLALGTQRKGVDSLPIRRGQPKATFQSLIDHGWPHSLVTVANAGYLRTGEAICGFVPLLWDIWVQAGTQNGTAGSLVSDTTPVQVAGGPTPKRLPTSYALGVPSYALDWFCREGRNALAAFLRSGSPTARLIHRHLPPMAQMDALGSLIFRVESSVVDQRLDWPTGIGLMDRADHSVARAFGADANVILNQMRADLPLLDAIRARTARASNSR